VNIIIGLLLAIVLLYFWLIGHWFARVLVFRVFAVIGFAAGIGLTSIVKRFLTISVAWLGHGPSAHRRRGRCLIRITLGGGRERGCHLAREFPRGQDQRSS
jgi:hypothetical protein